jgi:hypothetical protein
VHVVDCLVFVCVFLSVQHADGGNASASPCSPVTASDDASTRDPQDGASPTKSSTAAPAPVAPSQEEVCLVSDTSLLGERRHEVLRL